MVSMHLLDRSARGRIGSRSLTARRLGPVLTSSLALISWLATACHREAPPASRPPPAVTVRQPVKQEVMEWNEYPGRLEAVDMVELRARVSGYLQSVHFQDGAEVKKGDLLFVIDARPYQAELDRAEAEMTLAETRLQLAVNDLDRAERLLKTRAISEEETDTRSKAKREAEAAIEASRAMVESAKLNLGYTRITAPISGRISRKFITEGNLVNGNQGQSTLLTTLVSLDPIYCYFDVDEAAFLEYQKRAREGKQGSLREGKVQCELELANESGFPHQGVLDFTDNQLDPGTGTLRIRGRFSNPGPHRALEPGLFARVRVPKGGKYPALLVPAQAVGTDQSQKFVYVLDQKDEVAYRKVELGPLIRDQRVIRKGVEEADWVLVDGLMSVRPGMKVKANRSSEGAALPDGTGPAQP
jgi:membrane fusion protein, multidrug efflux system